jgi:hypothetical protein
MKTNHTTNTTSKTLKSLISKKIRNFKKIKAQALPVQRFNGAGVYALYYKGDNSLYKDIVGKPMFIGRVQPKGISKAEENNSAELYSKIKEQCKSIEEAKNLSLEDFQCKYMILDQVEMALSEAIENQLVNEYKPAWNVYIEGFANHNPGKGRVRQAPSEWDILHPGRQWAKKLQGKATNRESLKRKVKNSIKELEVTQ